MNQFYPPCSCVVSDFGADANEMKAGNPGLEASHDNAIAEIIKTKKKTIAIEQVEDILASNISDES